MWSSCLFAFFVCQMDRMGDFDYSYGVPFRLLWIEVELLESGSLFLN